VMLEQLPEPVDAVITSCAGYPLDLTFYQAIKGITAAQHILKPDGKILLIAECQEGAGAPEFCRMLKKTSSCSSFLSMIAESAVEIDQWQLEKLALVAKKFEILFYTPGLPVEFHEWLWGKVPASLESAVELLTAGLPKGAKIALMPEGPYVLAKAQAPELVAV
jgi:lactate racemase